MYFRKKTSGGRAYLQIVESRREGAAVRQQVIATLGGSTICAERTIGAAAALGRPLRGQSDPRRRGRSGRGDSESARPRAGAGVRTIVGGDRLSRVVETLAGARHHDFPWSAPCSSPCLHRLFSGGSDRAADRWRMDYRIGGATGLDLHHLYRAMAWLGEELAKTHRTPLRRMRRVASKTSWKRTLSRGGAICFSTLDLVFMDTTSLYFEGAGGQTLGRRGFSKDHRPDPNQMILAVLLDGDGRPVCTEMWPGNTADVGSLIPVIDRLRKRFAVNRVCVVADRGMISAETITELEARGLLC